MMTFGEPLPALVQGDIDLVVTAVEQTARVEGDAPSPGRPLAALGHRARRNPARLRRSRAERGAGSTGSVAHEGGALGYQDGKDADVWIADDDQHRYPHGKVGRIEVNDAPLA